MYTDWVQALEISGAFDGVANNYWSPYYRYYYYCC